MSTTKKVERKHPAKPRSNGSVGASDKVLAGLLKRLKETADPDEITRLSKRIEQVIFNK